MSNWIHKTSQNFWPHVCIKTIIDQCNAVNERLFSCFVDFQKAFDTVIHTGIKLRLLEIGVGTHSLFYNIIKNVYAASKSCIKVNNEITDYFETKLGVSGNFNPNLFKICINDLPKYLQETPDFV